MNKQGLLQYVDKKFTKKEHTEFNVGDTIRVHVKIVEGTSARVQVYEGLVISFSGEGGGRNFTVRKISFGVGVERAFPLNSPSIEKITVVRSGHVRRAKLYYLRGRAGKAARLSEKEAVTETQKPVSGAALSAAPLGNKPPELAVTKEK